MLELFKETPNDVAYTLMHLENIYWIEMLSYQVIQCYQLRDFASLILPVQLTPFPVNPGLHVQL